jgi:hypothetical protein
LPSSTPKELGITVVPLTSSNESSRNTSFRAILLKTSSLSNASCPKGKWKESLPRWTDDLSNRPLSRNRSNRNEPQKTPRLITTQRLIAWARRILTIAIDPMVIAEIKMAIPSMSGIPTVFGVN